MPQVTIQCKRIIIFINFSFHYVIKKLGSKKFLLAHRLKYMLHISTLHIPYDIHISHIYHQSLCISLLHLSPEPPKVNNERQLCKNMVPRVCLMKHAGFPDCLF